LSLSLADGVIPETRDEHITFTTYQKIITSRGSSLAHAYHVWLTSVTAIVSYPAHRTTDRMKIDKRPIALPRLPLRSKLTQKRSEWSECYERRDQF